MHPNAIRASFLTYFATHGHRTVASSPLVPHDDPTLLFTNAGMNQFKDVFLGREVRDYRRAATAQKCMRVSGKHNDLENVGPSLRHHTFFEMLGNFSFGDYFKEDAIALAWRLLTEEWGLDPARLRVTIFKGDAAVPRDEAAYRRWRDFVPAEHIGELGVDDNFWAMGDTGPCGRCSEIYVDRGPAVPGTGEFMADVAAGSERFVEIWNNVFMEFDRAADGVLTPLPAKSIDTGMGLERITAVLQGTTSNYDTPLFTPLLDAIGAVAGRRHGGTMAADDVSMRVIADHLRAMTFLIADGVVPSNEWRGYVLRKIMRRAMRHGRRLGLETAFLHRLVDVLVAEMGAAYPELVAGRDAVVQMVRGEEEKFGAVLSGPGLVKAEQVIASSRPSGVFPGDKAFMLYETYGMPRDFIEDLAAAAGLRFDADAFERKLAFFQDRNRERSTFDGSRKSDLPADARAALAGVADTFVGYDTLDGRPTPIVAILDDARALVDHLPAGGDGLVVLGETPFYVEAGGQVSDTGVLIDADGHATPVVDVVRLGAGLPRAHRVTGAAAPLAVGQPVTPRVDVARRAAIRRNHTGTHLLHAALRETLGGHVKQAGSLVAPDRLRFDFVHTAPLTPDERARIERIVNRRILANDPVHTAVKDTQQAIADGATALFGEKYGDRVRVVAIGDGGFSTELCGGTHVGATGDIGLLVVTEESGVAAGVRRVEALTGEGALAYLRSALDDLHRAAAAANVPPADLATRIDAQTAALTRAQREIRELKTKLAMGGGGSGRDAAADASTVGAFRVIVRRVDGLDREGLRALADAAKSTLSDGVVFLAGETAEGKVGMVAAATPGAAKKAPAGSLVKQLAPLVGGGGGGRPDFAEAGGKDPGKIADLLAAARPLIEKLLHA
ncbi:MAG: alanine--tRNA ligase [Vicinamibacterales bacterium]